MKTSRVFFFGLMIGTFVSCSQKVDIKDIEKLNGYWEIEKATLPDGTEKQFKINESVDFFEIKNNIGIRQKVMPQFDGHYLTSSGAENVTVKDSAGHIWLTYVTPYRKWTEKLAQLSETSMTMENEAGNRYQYKKYEGFSLKEHGEAKK